MKFDKLTNVILQTHLSFQQQAVKAINSTLTLRNWMIGYYIVAFEQHGEERAKYGESLLDKLSDSINVAGLGARSLKLFRQFYLVYPQIVQTVSAQSYLINNQPIRIDWTPSDQFQLENAPMHRLGADATWLPPEKLLSNLSFSHFAELLVVKDPEKRAFYELECIKGGWGVRELKRQINSLYYERSGMSKSPAKLSAMVAEKAVADHPATIIKSVYTFEFLGLKAKDVVEENDLETALLDHLQEFMLEMGNGFCFEARQKKILIGNEYFFVDIVFYHRILKCHVLVELKVEEFNHNNIGQLNTYVNYYKTVVKQPDDNPPVGILLVTDKNSALVEFATAGIDNQLFVSKYLVELPAKENLQAFIQNEINNWK